MSQDSRHAVPGKETIFIPCVLEFDPQVHVPTKNTFGASIESRQTNAIYYCNQDGTKPEGKYDASLHNIYPLILVACNNPINNKLMYKWVTSSERY